jgi:hypothetical protein
MENEEIDRKYDELAKGSKEETKRFLENSNLRPYREGELEYDFIEDKLVLKIRK